MAEKAGWPKKILRCVQLSFIFVCNRFYYINQQFFYSLRGIMYLNLVEI